MATPDSINAAQKAKVAKKYPGAVANPDIFIGGPHSDPSPKSKIKYKKGPRLPIYKETRDKIV